MRSIIRAIRFYRVAAPVPPLMLASFVAVTAAALAAIAWAPDGAPRATVPVLVLQIFAASNGFAGSARRGYYDALLTGGVGRLTSATVHWGMSVAPGSVCCGLLQAVQTITSEDGGTGSASGTAAALFVVSTLPWATTMAMPRFSGAIGWLLLAVTALSLVPQAQTPLPEAVTFLLLPVTMAGADAGSRMEAIAPGVALASASMIVALLWLWRTDLPLEAGQ